jgi:serine/threonine-protein kinase
MVTVVFVLGLIVGVSKLSTDNPRTIAKPVSAPSTPQAAPGMVYIPGGEFEMGSDRGDEYERPAHTQWIEPFFIDVDEVTCEAYSHFVKEKNYQSPPGWKGADYPAGSARKPVTGVTWYDALAYAKWAGKRLPTEAEWEYAARGSKGYRYPWGNEWKAGQANAEKTATGLSDVGTFKGASQFGLRDMSGNAWEWTSTTIEAYPGGKLDEAQLPKEPREEVKVIRGGCYLSSAEQATTTYRYAWPAKGKYSFAQTGFRCARDAK